MTKNGNAQHSSCECAQPATQESRETGTVTFTPRVDIVENDKELILFADVPGVRSEDIELRYERGQLHLTGRVQPRLAGKTYSLQEYEVGDFSRTFTLHDSIDSSGIEAACKNGVLTVHLPKVKSVQPRQISVKSA